MTSFHANAIAGLEDWVETTTGVAVAGVYPGRRRANVAHSPVDIVIRRGEVESVSLTGHDDLWVHRYEIEVSVAGSPGFNQAGKNLQDTLDGHLQLLAAGVDGTRILSDFIPEIVAVNAGEIVADEDPGDAGRVVGILGVEFLVNGSGSAFPGAPSAALSTVAAGANAIADGGDSIALTVTILDASSNPVPGVLVVLAGTGIGNTITQPSALTNSSGVATGSIVSTVQAAKTISATANGSAVTATDVATFALSPATILGSALAAWFDASDATTITSGANGVSAWSDNVSGNPDLVQATDANKPNVGAAAVNSLDALLFVGANSELLHAAAPVTASPFRVFAVVKALTVSPATNYYIVGLTDEGNEGQERFYGRVTGTGGVGDAWQWRATSGGSGQDAVEQNVVNGSTRLFMCVESGTRRDVEVDGQLLDGSPELTTVAPTGIDKLDVGSFISSGTPSNGFDGYICEIVIVDETAGVISAQQLSDLEDYFERWGITIP